MTADVALVVGASASGKSRLIAGVLEIASKGAVLGQVRVAERLTTRAARVNESLPGENCFLDAAAFQRGVDEDVIDVHWDRGVGAARRNRYGFRLAEHLAEPGLVVLSGNNYLPWPEIPLLARLRSEGRLVVVRVWADPATRMARLQARRPLLDDDELAARMRDVPVTELLPADHLIPNDPQFEATASWEFLRLLTSARFYVPKGA